MDKAKVNKWLNALNDNSYNKAAVLSAAAASLSGAAPAGRWGCCFALDFRCSRRP